MDPHNSKLWMPYSCIQWTSSANNETTVKTIGLLAACLWRWLPHWYPIPFVLQVTSYLPIILQRRAWIISLISTYAQQLAVGSGLSPHWSTLARKISLSNFSLVPMFNACSSLDLNTHYKMLEWTINIPGWWVWSRRKQKSAENRTPGICNSTTVCFFPSLLIIKCRRLIISCTE